jgi:hypothetical protein
MAFYAEGAGMYVYTIDSKDTSTYQTVDVIKLLVELDPLRRTHRHMIVGPYLYPDKGTSIIPDSVWDQYREMISVNKWTGKRWSTEKRMIITGEKHSMATSWTITIKLHEPDFPLDFMMQATPEIRQCLKLVRKT